MNYDGDYDYDSELIFDAANGSEGGAIVPVVVVVLARFRST